MSKITKNERINALEQQVKGLIEDCKLLSRHVDCTSEYKPKLKQLDQSVFDGSHEMWKFAAVDEDGSVFKFAKRPDLTDDYWSNVNRSRFDRVSVEGIYDTSNWQNSLIEREKKELTGSGLCRAMLERGDKCVMIRMGVRDDKQALLLGRFAIATSIDESGRFNVMSDQQPISKVNFAVPINNQGEPLTAAEVGL